jgi:ArsR family transcriptional regulator
MPSGANHAPSHILMAYTALFKALSDETRLRIFLLLKDELCVCQIQVALALSQTKISRHLTVLRNAGLVTTRRDGLWMYYSRAVPESPPLRSFVQQLAARLEDDPGLMASVVSDPRYATLPPEEIGRMSRELGMPR